MLEQLQELFFHLYHHQLIDRDLDMPWKKLGLDSLDYAEFIIEVESEFEVTITDDSADELKTPNELLEFIRVAKIVKYEQN